MTYMDSFPHYIAFYAKRAADVGGKTLVSNVLKQTLDLEQEHPCLAQKLKTEGVEYLRNMPCEDHLRATGAPAAYKTWQDAFHTSDRDEASASVSAGTCQLTWRPLDGACTWTSRRPAFSQCPSSGDEVLMNQIDALHSSWLERIYGDSGFFASGEGGGGGDDDNEAPAAGKALLRTPLFHTRWGSGEDFTEEELAALRGVVARHLEEVDLATGDLVVLDNYRWTHGRAPYQEGADRQLLVCMSEMRSRVTAHAPKRGDGLAMAEEAAAANVLPRERKTVF
jgi:hypothetical protein